MVAGAVRLRPSPGLAVPAHYATGAVVPDVPELPELIHRPHGTLPYTPPIPLYLALCRVTGTAPAWSRPVSA